MNNDTILRMKKMRLPSLVKNFQEQLDNSYMYSSMTFEERVALMIDAEYEARENNKIKRLLKQASLPDSSAHLAGIEYFEDRHLDKELINSLGSNEFIRKGLNIMLIGATGCGKTYIACALATNACRHEYRTIYFRLNEFFSEMETARLQGTYDAVITRLSKIPLLILDDYLLLPTTPEQQQDLLILLRSRDETQRSTILCSQVSVAGWHERLGSGGVADTLLDRVTTNGYEINIDGDVSMRKRHSRI